MRRFDDDAVPQIPVKTAVLLAPAATVEPIVTFGVETVLEARLGALEAAAARYALNLHRRCSLLAEPAPAAEAVVPERLESWLGVPAVGARWVAATGLTDRAALGLPRSAVLAGPLDWKAAEFEPELSGSRPDPRRPRPPRGRWSVRWARQRSPPWPEASCRSSGCPTRRSPRSSTRSSTAG
jgi:hypothetical protein